MTRTAIFLGPSLAGQARAPEVSGAPRVLVRPPVRHGDLLDLPDVERGGWDVYIVDGEFGQSLAVTVTEIRTVLRAGNRVAGCSSMGALRAAECGPIGMTGHGWVYEAYASGAIDGDDEVALLYDPDTYEPVTVPSVNVRWLVTTLVRDGRLGQADADRAVAVTRAIFFGRRTPGALRRALCAEGLDAVAEHVTEDRLSTWDRKRRDAAELVRTALVA
ncbi:TfuA-like protein [Actinophytocola sp.]|uniref:TfuA-like protein n=1 Tax=Actinophytocola sp. TaxID=1872138 RepID=UPI003D6A9E1D